jgi:hypothetical protein
MGSRKHLAVALLIAAAGVDCAPAEDLPSAEALWERVTDAKGGRQRLHAVRSILITQGHVKQGRTHIVRLFVFPDAFWSYIDYGRSVLGREAYVIRGDLVVRSTQLRFETKPSSRASPARRYGIREFISASTVHLLETAWSRPELFNPGTAKLNRRPHYTVDASSEGASFRYFPVFH